MEELFLVFGLMLFGMVLSSYITVFKKVKSEGFSMYKFFNKNKQFWAVCFVGAVLFATGITYVEGFAEIINFLGFDIKDTHAGYVLLGIAMAITSDKSGISGSKTLIKPKQVIDQKNS